MRIVETFSRGLLRALKSQFRSAPQALRELIDNALDQSQGQRIEIEVIVSDDLIVVQNIGGRGMGIGDLQQYVAWGVPATRAEGDIGSYSQGGKSAIAYFGNAFRLYCRRAGTSDAYCLEDHKLFASLEPRDYGELYPLAPDLIPGHLRRVDKKRGYVRIEITDVDKSLALDVDRIRRDFSAVYGRLLRKGRMTINVNGTVVESREVVLDHSVEPVAIVVDRDGLHIEGFAAKLARDANRSNMPKPGLSLYWRGRRIEENQWFGSSGYGKGSLAAFYGEIEIEGWFPNLNKSAFVEEGSAQWIEIGEEIMRQAKPVLDALRSGSDPTQVTARDRRIAKQVRKELTSVMELLLGQKVLEVEEHVVKRLRVVKEGPQRERVATRSGKGAPTPKHVEEGEDEKRVTKDVIVPDMPEIVMSVWDAPVRAETREHNGRMAIHINKAHPAFGVANARFAIAESAICELLRMGGGMEGIDDYVGQLDEVLATWASVTEDGEDE